MCMLSLIELATAFQAPGNRGTPPMKSRHPKPMANHGPQVGDAVDAVKQLSDYAKVGKLFVDEQWGPSVSNFIMGFAAATGTATGCVKALVVLVNETILLVDVCSKLGGRVNVTLPSVFPRKEADNASSSATPKSAPATAASTCRWHDPCETY